jgi:hypothetical protein
VERDGSGHSEHAGLPADVLERAVGRPGDDAAAEAAEELDAAAAATAEDTGRREMHVLVRRRALRLRRRRPLRRHRVLYLSHEPAAVNQSSLTRKQAIDELPPKGLRRNNSTSRHQFCPRSRTDRTSRRNLKATARHCTATQKMLGNVLLGLVCLLASIYNTNPSIPRERIAQ